MKELTKAEEQVMQMLWKLEGGFVNQVIEELPEPKPAYNTVSTIIRILEKKGFVGFEAFGRSHRYHPIVGKDEYRSFSMGRMINNYFKGSFAEMVSFFVKDNEMSLEEIEKVKEMIDQSKEKK
ncbi:MAG: BlaI family penicillinase repressor [Granulosicoccus sp.]|jgi:BlaI family penicillinase repressor